MNLPVQLRRAAGALAAASLFVILSPPALAHGPAAALPAPRALAVAGPLPPPAPGVAELKFSEFFQLPVGPRGLVPSDRLLRLHGRDVRVVGYMAAAGVPMPGRLVLAPLPITLGADDEHLADDLPPQALFVHLTGAASASILPNYAGPLVLTGRLEVGPREEPDGHVSLVRLVLGAAASSACLPDAQSLLSGFWR